ncbi:MAG: hypothetical protein LBR60_09835 [Fibrobacter sp.]|jgi:hypothetical protein|nr:hypothetical protein [Fibrobacter sp.]
MKKLVLWLIFVSVSFTFAQESKVQFGLKAGFSEHIMTADFNDYGYEMVGGLGFGFELGGAVRIPLGSRLSIAPEVNLEYHSIKDPDIDVSLNEWMLNTPVTLQFTPRRYGSFFFAVGLLLDIPVYSKVVNNDNKDNWIKGRKDIYINVIPLGLGFTIKNKVKIDCKLAIIGNTDSSLAEVNHVQLKFGVAYYLN